MQKDEKWSKYYTITSIVCSSLIAMISVITFSIGSNMKQYHDNRELELQIRKLNIDERSRLKENYNRDYRRIKKVAKIISDLQATITEETKICENTSIFSFYNKEDKNSKLGELQDTRFFLSKNFISELTILDHFDNYEIYPSAKLFLDMLNAYPDPCAVNVPPEKKWVMTERVLISSLVSKLKKKYPAYLYNNQL